MMDDYYKSQQDKFKQIRKQRTMTFLILYSVYMAFTFCLSLVIGSIWAWLTNNNDMGVVMAYVIFFGFTFLFLNDKLVSK